MDLRPLTPDEQQTVLDNIGLAKKIASTIAGAMATDHQFLYWQYFDELIDSAYIGLCIAVQKFDPSLELKLSTLAWTTIRRAITRGSADAQLRYGTTGNRRLHRDRVSLFSERRPAWIKDDNKEVSNTIDVADCRGNSVEYDPEPSPELLTLIRLALDERWARIVIEHVLNGKSMRAIGAELGITFQRVQQILGKALAELRETPGVLSFLYAQVEKQRRSESAWRIDGLPMFVA